MQVNKKLVFFVLIMLMYLSISAQELFPKDTSGSKEFMLSVEIGAGGSYYSIKPNVPLHLETDVNRIQQAYTLRLNWKTDHRLTVSLESGYFKMYSFTMKGASSEGSLVITAVPVLLEFSMPLTKKFDVRVGAGSYYQTSYLNYLGKVKSGSVSLGWIAGGSYYFYVKNYTTAGIEMKWMDAAEAEQAVVALQLSYRYTFHKW